MPIPYLDQDDLDQLGAAAFLKLETEADGGGYRGALLQINARGEPLEFTYNRVATPSPFLWRGADLRRLALAHLTVSLLDASRHTPTLFCYLASDAPLELFSEDIQIGLPVGRVLPADAGGTESIAWQPSAPSEASVAWRLARELDNRRLLLEPFERASAGLAEVYARSTAAQP